MIRTILAAVVLMLAACAQPPVAPSDPAPQAAEKVDWQAAQNAEQCAAIEGAWRPICLMGTPACVVNYKDAGESCSDSSECSGRCVTPSMGSTPPGTATKGVCTATSDPCGCFQLVTNGKADHPLCAD